MAKRAAPSGRCLRREYFGNGEAVNSDRFRGVLAMVLAASIWGLSPIFYKALAAVRPLEVLSHRTLWSFVLFGLVLAWQRRLGDLSRLLASRRGAGTLLLAGVLISVNWFTFIFAVQIGLTVESSLGYFIFPLVAVALGYLFAGERLDRGQTAAVALTVLAVLILSIGLGTPPWVALVVSTTFGTYGLIKKFLAVGPILSVTGEVLLLMPLALIWLYGVHFAGWTGVAARPGGYFGRDPVTTGLLVISGVITAGPLMLFSYATRRLRLSTVGVIQYLNPSLQFMVAVLVFGEAFTGVHAIAFALIWLALALYSLAGLAKSPAKARSSPETSVTTDM